MLEAYSILVSTKKPNGSAENESIEWLKSHDFNKYFDWSAELLKTINANDLICYCTIN
jgi:hypothetical protein